MLLRNDRGNANHWLEVRLKGVKSNREGLGSRLTFYSSYINMPMFFATILLLALLGITIYIIFYFIGKKWASWES